ncbi:hypothetical protein COCMIDRAFT_86190, partial [Bipolaris oryzae ATCC 44560]
KQASEDLVMLNSGSMPLAMPVSAIVPVCEPIPPIIHLGVFYFCLWHWFPSCFIARMICRLC